MAKRYICMSRALMSSDGACKSPRRTALLPSLERYLGVRIDVVFGREASTQGYFTFFNKNQGHPKEHPAKEIGSNLLPKLTTIIDSIEK